MTALLPLLFDRNVATCEVELGLPLAELHPHEAEVVRRARPRRILEFRAGRHCARAALERLGVEGVALLPSIHRVPEWPSGFVGSISHTGDVEQGWCGAAVARKDGLESLGLDAELAAPLEPDLWPLVLRPEEVSFIQARPAIERGLWAKLFFSAKEATYKCQFPVSVKFLEFQDVSVKFDEASRQFSATLEREAPPFGAGATFQGRFVKTAALLATAVVLENRRA